MDTFTVPRVGLSFVDWQNSSRQEIQASKEILWQVLQQDLIDIERPGVTLCQPVPGMPDTGTDPALPNINFVVYNGRTIVGAFNIYDIKRNPDAPGMVGKACPGIVSRDSVPRVVAEVMRWIEENDLYDQGDGSTIDFEWDFPDFPGHSWGDGPVANEVVAEMETAGHTVTRRADGSPEKVRRTRSVAPRGR